MTVRFDINVNAWINNIEVEGDSIEDCKKKLASMSIADMLDSYGNEKSVEITDVDADIIEAESDVEVTDVSYDNDDAEMENIDVTKLPTEFHLTVRFDEYNDLTNAVRDEIYNQTNLAPIDFNVKVLNRK